MPGANSSQFGADLMKHARFPTYFTVASTDNIIDTQAWAITVHKAQGMSLDRCIIKLTDEFCGDGQAYVALSRGAFDVGSILLHCIT